MAMVKDVKRIEVVFIPSRVEHEGIYSCRVFLYWTCPVCGGPRGKIGNVLSYDGSRRMTCNGWNNPCGHIDKYENCRVEALENGLNPDLVIASHFDLTAIAEVINDNA